MKFQIQHNAFLTALRKGGIATTIKDAANPDLYRKQPILKCVKLTTDKSGLTVESSALGISARTFIPKNEVKIEIADSVCVEAPDLISDLGNLMYPHNLVVEFDPEQIKADASIPPRLWVRAFNDKGRESFAWSYDIYPTRNFPKVPYSEEPPKASVNVGQMRKAMSAVAITIVEEDTQHILDNIIVYLSEDKMYIATTDIRRGAIVKIPEVTNVKAEKEERYLINFRAMEKVLNCFDDSASIDLVLESDGEHLTVNGPEKNTCLRLSLPPANLGERFGNMLAMLKIKSKVQVEIEKKEFLQAVNVIVNRQLFPNFHFDEGKEEILINYSQRNRPAIIGCSKISTGLNEPLNLSSRLFLDILKKIEGESVSISVTEDERRILVKDSDDPNYFYLMLRVKNPPQII